DVVLASATLMRERAALVFRTGQLGDTLVALPALRAVRRRLPGHRLVLLTDRQPSGAYVSSWTLLRETGWFDEVVFYEPRSWARANTLRAAGRLGVRHFEHVFNLAPWRNPAQRRRDGLVFRGLLRPEHYHADAGPVPRDGEPEWHRLLRIVNPE